MQGYSSLTSYKYEMTMMGELTFFLGIQVNQNKSEISIYQQKYIKELLKKFEMDGAKTNSFLITTTTNFDKDEAGVSVVET